MHLLLLLAFLTLTTFACTTIQSPKSEKARITIQATTDTIFRQVVNFPTIKDTTQFISTLQQVFDLQTDNSSFQKTKEKISTYTKVKIYGSDKEYIFMEYDYAVGCMAAYPWKYQLLLTLDGKLVKGLAGQRFEFVEIFKNENPFLLIVVATSKGNGGHEIYKISADILENVYEGYFDYEVQTYKANEFLCVFEPNELNIKFIDNNRDGYNDIVFTGEKLMLGKYTKDSVWYDVENGKPFSPENPADRIPLKYVFLYDKETGHFKAKEKYGLDD